LRVAGCELRVNKGRNPQPATRNSQLETMIQFEIQNSVAKIVLNRPDVYNSLNRDMALEIQRILDECAENQHIRAVYITGAGKAYGAGQDLQEILDPPNGMSVGDIVNQHYNPTIRKIRALEKPVIAAVNGVAAGAAANIALACDVVIATESATFIQAFSKIGLIPDSGGTFFLPRLVGWQKASALAMLGDKVTAREAEAMGMIYKAVPDEEFEATAWKIATKLAAMPTKGLGLTKRLLNQSLTNDLNAQLDAERDIQEAASNTEDYQEGVNAFLEKRKPTFKGA